MPDPVPHPRSREGERLRSLIKQAVQSGVDSNWRRCAELITRVDARYGGEGLGAIITMCAGAYLDGASIAPHEETLFTTAARDGTLTPITAEQLAGMKPAVVWAQAAIMAFGKDDRPTFDAVLAGLPDSPQEVGEYLLTLVAITAGMINKRAEIQNSGA